MSGQRLERTWDRECGRTDNGQRPMEAKWLLRKWAWMTCKTHWRSRRWKRKRFVHENNVNNNMETWKRVFYFFVSVELGEFLNEFKINDFDLYSLFIPYAGHDLVSSIMINYSGKKCNFKKIPKVFTVTYQCNHCNAQCSRYCPWKFNLHSLGFSRPSANPLE